MSQGSLAIPLVNGISSNMKLRPHANGIQA